MHKCHSAKEIVNTIKKVLSDHKDWEELLVKSLKDANENAKKNLNKEYYKRYMIIPATTLTEYYVYLEWLTQCKPHEYSTGYDKNIHPADVFNKEVFFQNVSIFNTCRSIYST